MSLPDPFDDFGPHRGWAGAFTRNQADGCFPNGAKVRKIREDPGGDFHPVGSLGKVLGSVCHPSVGACYFIEWNDHPKVATVCVASKLELAT